MNFAAQLPKENQLFVNQCVQRLINTFQSKDFFVLGVITKFTTFFIKPPKCKGALAIPKCCLNLKCLRESF